MKRTLCIILGALLLADLPYALAESPPSLSSLLGEEVGFHQYLPAEKLDIFGMVETDVQNLTMLTRLCAHEVDELFNDNRTPAHRLNFYAMDISFSESDFKTWDVPLQSSAPLEASVVKILQGLLMRQLRERLGLKRGPAPCSVNFIAAALANRIVYDGKGTTGLYQKDYRIPRRQFAMGAFPDVVRLFTEVPSANSRLLYRLYLVHCDLLFSFLQSTKSRQGQPFLLEWWRLECKENLGTSAALSQLLDVPEGKLQEWYVANVPAYARQGMIPDSSTGIADRLKKLLTISVLEMGGTQTMRTVSIEELPAMLKNRPLDLFTLDGVQMDLMKLKLNSPPIYHETLDLYIAALDALRQNDIKTFQKRFTNAKKALENAESLQQRITTMLNEAENTLGPVDSFRAANWQAILEHRRNLRKPLDRAAGFPE
ncbi:MAG: hypothetical protein II943_03300 [Victivallales bacterium]|nr:hypothetical protein [Victivallales bacterium]